MAEVRRRRRSDQPQIQGNKAQRHNEQGGEQQRVSPGDAAALPPVQNHQCGGQRDHHVLGQHPGAEQQQRQAIAPSVCRGGGRGCRAASAIAKGCVASRCGPSQKWQPDPDAGQIEQPGKHVLALDGPSDGFDMQRMHGEDRGGQPSPRHGQTSQNPPKQQRVGPMQQHVHHMVAGGIEAPEFLLQPKAGVDEGPIVRLMRFAWREPDAPQAVPIPQRRFPRNVLHIVPDEAAPQYGRQVA